MTDMDAFDRLVAREVVRASAPPRSVDDAAIFSSITTTRSPRWRFPSVFSAIRFAAAGAIVALFGWFLMAGVLTTPHGDEPAPAVGASTTPDATHATPRPVELPTDIPAAIDSGTLDTPLGHARWVHLTGDESTLPRTLTGLLSTPDGYVVPEFSQWAVPERGARLWRSTDLIEWTAESLSIAGEWGRLSHAGDTYWLSMSDPASLWRSADSVSWEQVSLKGLHPSLPEGEWMVQPGEPVTSGSVTIVPLLWYPDDSLVSRLPGAEGLDAPAMVETAPGVYQIRNIESVLRGRLGEETFASLRFQETGDGLRVLDAREGTELTVLAGVSEAFMDLLAWDDAQGRIGDIEVRGLGIVEYGALTAVEPPLWSLSPRQQAFRADRDGFVSYTLGPDDPGTLAPDSLVIVHRSSDGRTWSETDIIGDDPSEPRVVESIAARHGVVTLDTFANRTWTVADGLVREPFPPGGVGIRLGDGWVQTPMLTDQPWVTVITDGGEPMRIDVAELSFPSTACAVGEDLLSSNTLAVVSEEGCAWPREAWIVSFDDLPA